MPRKKRDVFSIKKAIANIKKMKNQRDNPTKLDKSNADKWVDSKDKYLDKGYE